MTLLAHALTQRADTPTAVLARIAQLHPQLTYAVLAHPNAPDGLPHGLTCDPADLHTTLYSPAVTPAGRQRLLRHLSPAVTGDYVVTHSDAHPDALPHALRNAADPWTVTAVLSHPDIDPDTHLAALRIALSADDEDWDPDNSITAAILTHATRHGAHLTELATLLRHTSRHDRGGTQALIDELPRYAHVHTHGGDAHTARLRDIATSDLDPAEKIRWAVDPTLAGTLLTAHPTPDVARAILSTDKLTHTDAAYRALHLVSVNRGYLGYNPLPDAQLPPPRPDTRYTRAQLLTTPGWLANAPLPDTLNELAAALATDPDAAATLADTTLDTLGTLGIFLRSELTDALCHLALHPATPTHHRAQLTHAARTLTGAGTPERLAVDIADHPHTLTRTPLPELRDVSEATDTHHYLAQTLARTLPTLDADTLATALTLELVFTGTLDELLDTARAVTT